MKLRFLLPSDEFDCICSMCDQPAELLARLELREVIVNGIPAFAGLCRSCVEQLMTGFDRAEAKMQAGEIDTDEEEPPQAAQ
jgi:hypothetical protein